MEPTFFPVAVHYLLFNICVLFTFEEYIRNTRIICTWFFKAKLQWFIGMFVRVSRLLVCYVLLLSQSFCSSEPLMGQTYSIRSTFDDTTCRLEHVQLSFNTSSDTSCVYRCSIQLLSSGIVYNEDNDVCICCSEMYTTPDGLPSDFGTKYYIATQDVYTDCKDAQSKGVLTSGVQRVTTPVTSTVIEVYCDMDTRDGGWLVFQNRFNGSVTFYRNFSDYEEGFGDVRGEYWLGLRNLYEFTTTQTMLYVKFVDVNDVQVYELFSGFSLDQGPEYAFQIGDFLEANDGSSPPNYTDSFASTRKVGFSTADVIRDTSIDSDCAIVFEAGWWFRKCAQMNPNGPYREPGTTGDRNTMMHKIWKGFEALKETRIMIRRP